MVLLDHRHQQAQQSISFPLFESITNIFIPHHSRTQRQHTSPTKSTTSPYYPLTVRCEDKNGKMTPFELVLKANATIRDVHFHFT